MNRFLAAALAGTLLAGCTRPAAPPATTGGALFEDIAPAAGVRFTLTNGQSERLYFLESTPAGVAFLDYDSDGFVDLFLVQSGPSDPPAQVRNRPRCALFRNNGDGSFTETTRAAGLDRDLGYAHGAAVGDYDNDGRSDLLVTSYPRNFLFHNDGGRFDDVSAAMGIDKTHSTGYATSAAFGDYDNDGRLDLYICYYCPWTHATDKPCKNAKQQRDYCTPEIYLPDTHQLLHNDGRRFVDRSVPTGIAREKGRGLAVAFVDYDRDGWQDIFVANDITANLLWRNQGDGTFRNVAVETGCAYSENGTLMAGMGIGVADYDHSGRESLFVTNFSGMPNTLFRNDGALFEDMAVASRIATPHLKYLSFGVEFFDYDADTWPDLVTANGHVQLHVADSNPATTLKEPKSLYRNRGDGTFEPVTPERLGDLARPEVARGLAVADFDNDGRLDILASNQNAPVQLLRNRTGGNGNHWVSFLTIGMKSNREGRHARFTLETADGVRQTATVRAGSSYLSASDRRVYFGLGRATKIKRVEIRWPSGTVDRLSAVPIDTGHVVTEGQGRTGTLPGRRP